MDEQTKNYHTVYPHEIREGLSLCVPHVSVNKEPTLVHIMRSEEEVQNLEDINWSSLNLDKDEAAARGTQIKSMLGIKDNTPITADQLKYMQDNFVRLTGMDNNMQAFLNSITDFENAAKWLSKNAYSLGGALNLLGLLKHPSGKKGL